MKVWNNITSFKAKNTCLTIGSFDGVHLGHIEVLNQLKNIAQKFNGESVVFTLHPHPAMVFNPNKKFSILNTVKEKIKLLENAGIDHLILFPFSIETSKLSYDEFVRDILVKQLNIKSLLVGYDNTIGKDKKGNFEELKKLASILNFELYQQHEIRANESTISSTQIRKLLGEGRLNAASKLLGYPYMVSGEVMHGKKLGKKLGFPTANILPEPNKFIPAMGVYIVKVLFKNRLYNGMMNIGNKPTISDGNNLTTMEVNLFNFNDSLYSEYIEVSILKKIRDEFKFDSLEALKAQIEKDRMVAIDYFQYNKDINI